MNHDVTVPARTYDGKLLPLNSANPEPATLRDILVQSCLAASPQKHATGEAKFKIHGLLTRIHSAEKCVELTAEEVTLLKTLVGDAYPVLIVGPVYDLLEGKTPAASE